MNKLALDYYLKTSGFHDAVFLPDSPLSWEDARKKAPNLIKGWHELCRLSPEDRIEFTRDYWFSILPFIPKALEGISSFFDRLDDVGVFFIQEKEKMPYSAEFVYSLKNEGGFFRGGIPCTHEAVDFVKHTFHSLLPRDFLAFLRIHNGFSKYSDTGIIRIQDMPLVRTNLQSFLIEGEKKVSCDGIPVDPAGLIPFYESFGQQSYQCFYSEWYPTSEMGNVYFSSQDFTISPYTLGNPQETMAFPTFLDWLVFYLEGIEA